MKAFQRSWLLWPVAAVLAAVLGAAWMPLPATAQEASPAAVVSLPLTGGAVETAYEKGVYSYMQVQFSGGKPVWLMAPVCQVRKGDKVDVQEGKVYAGVFNSELGVTFDVLVVGTKFSINGQNITAFAAHDLPPGCTIRR